MTALGQIGGGDKWWEDQLSNFGSNSVNIKTLN